MAAIKYDCYELVEWLIKEKGLRKEECETLSKRLVHFAHSFCKQFDEKICAYCHEATGTSFKKSKATEFLIGTFAGALGGAATYAAGLGTSGFKLAQTSGQKAYEFMTNKPREKAIKRTLKIQELVKETNIQKLFIKIATNVFITHQQQLMKFIDEEDWLRNVERLVENAVKIILSYFEEYEKDEKLKLESIVLMAFLNNKNKTLFFETSKGAIKKVGKDSKRLIKWQKKHWTFERFSEEKCGFVTKINEEVKYFCILSARWSYFVEDLNLIKFLLKAGFDPSKANVYGQTAFMVAAYFHREQAIACLLPTLTNSLINRRCCDGRTMFENYDVQITNLFTSTLQNSSTISRFYFREASIKSRNAIEILLKYDAGVNKEDNFGA